MKRTVYLVLALVMTFSISGVVLAEDITIVGTGSGMSLLQSVGEIFTQKNPDTKIIVPESIGSSGGIKSVGADKYKIGRVSREIKDTEKHYDLKYLPFAKLPIVFFVNKKVGIKELTPRQICDIYNGKITNWKDLGGADESIRLIRREDGDSALQALIASFPGFREVKLAEKSKITYTDQETVLLAEQKESTIAFAPYSNLLNRDVTVLSTGEKKPADADYPYFSVLALIFKEANNTGSIKKFVDFVKSPDVQDAIKKSGGLPY